MTLRKSSFVFLVSCDFTVIVPIRSIRVKTSAGVCDFRSL